MSIYSIKVTKINDNFHARLKKGSKIISEMACKSKQDIGFICRELLRWEDKMGGDKFTSSARNRQNNNEPVDKIWNIEFNK